MDPQVTENPWEGPKKKFSGMGIASFVLGGIIVFVLFVAFVAMLAVRPSRDTVVIMLAVLSFFTTLLCLTGLGLGIAGFTDKNKKRLFSTIGLITHCVGLVFAALAFAAGISMSAVMMPAADGSFPSQKENPRQYDRPEDAPSVKGTPWEEPGSGVDTPSTAPLKQLSLHLDEDRWKLDYSAEQNGYMIYEFVQKGETVNHWSELVAVDFLSYPTHEVNVPQYVQSFVNGLERTVKREGGQVKWRVINENPSDVLFEFVITDHPVFQDQHEIGRVFSTKKGLFHVHYIIKKAPMSEETRQKWIRFLMEVYPGEEGAI